MHWPPTWSNWILAGFAAIAALIVAYSLGAIKEQATASLIAAQAAKKASRIAEQSLRLVNQPWLDTNDWTVTERRSEGIPDAMGGRSRGKLLGFTVKFSVANDSRTPATIYHIEMRDSGSGSPPIEYVVTEVVQNLITPESAHPYQAVIDNLSQSQLASYETGNDYLPTLLLARSRRSVLYESTSLSGAKIPSAMPENNPYQPKKVVSSRFTRVNVFTSETQGSL